MMRSSRRIYSPLRAYGQETLRVGIRPARGRESAEADLTAPAGARSGE